MNEVFSRTGVCCDDKTGARRVKQFNVTYKHLDFHCQAVNVFAEVGRGTVSHGT